MAKSCQLYDEVYKSTRRINRLITEIFSNNGRIQLCVFAYSSVTAGAQYIVRASVLPVLLYVTTLTSLLRRFNAPGSTASFQHQPGNQQYNYDEKASSHVRLISLKNKKSFIRHGSNAC